MLFVTLFWEIVALAIETELNSKYFELCFQVFVLSKFGDRRAKLVDKNFPKVIFRGHFEIVSEHLFSGIYVKIKFIMSWSTWNLWRKAARYLFIWFGLRTKKFVCLNMKVATCKYFAKQCFWISDWALEFSSFPSYL